MAAAWGCLGANPHLHVVFLDGVYREDGAELTWQALRNLQTREVGEVLERAVRRMARYLRRRGKLAADADIGNDDAAGNEDDDAEGEQRLAASAVSGQTPPAGPQWLRGLAPIAPRALAFDKPLCASLDGFTLHAATRAGALDTAGREALLRYILRPPIAQERVESTKDGLVRIALKRAYSDGTVAVEMDPLSLLCRLATSVPPSRYHTVKYAGVLASASKWRARIAPKPVVDASVDTPPSGEPARRGCKYRPWAELLRRTFALDVLECPKCKGRMKLLAMVTEAKGIRRFLASTGEQLEPPTRAPNRGPPYWASTVLRRKAFGDVA
jgi:Putative transposase